MSLLSSWIGKRVKLTEGSFWSAWYGGETYTDKVVTPNTALHVAAAWACIRLLSETVGTLPISVYRREANGTKVAIRDHWLYSLVHDDPNADQTAPEFWEASTGCLNLWGNGYSEKMMGRGDRVIALAPLNPETTRPYRDSDGNRRYRGVDRGQSFDLPEEKVFHIRGFGFGGDAGLSPIAYARNSLGIAMSAEEAAGRVFQNGLQAAGFVTAKSGVQDKQLSPLQGILDKFAGSRNAGKVMALPADFDFKQVSMNPEDAQLLMSRSWSVEEICRWFRVPPFMIGHTEKSTSWGTGLEQQMIGFLTFTLRPWLTRIEQAIAKDLLTPADRNRFYPKFSVEGLLRADSVGRAAFYGAMTDRGVITRDEIRELEDLPPMGGNAAVLTVQSAMVPLDSIGMASESEQARAAMRAFLGFDEQPARIDA